MSRFFSRELDKLTPYTPGEQPRDAQYIKLNTNESPYPPSPKAIAYAAESAQRLQLYPDPTCKELTQTLAKELGVESDEVLLGNGSDEILFFAFRAFCDSETGAAFPNISYGFYEVFAGLCKTDYTKIPLKEDLTLAVEDYLGLGRTIFIANPNAPTGIALTLDEIEKIVKSNPDRVVVIDEAYVDFGAQSAVPLIKKYDNLLVVQTFSKSRSMAGARLGMGIACSDLIRDLNTIKYSLNPYNINRMTMAAGLGILADTDYTRDCCKKIAENRSYTQSELARLGFSFPDSSANFVFARHPKISGEKIYRRLKEKGVLVRHFDNPLITDYNRITIGTKEQTDALITALSEIMEEEQ